MVNNKKVEGQFVLSPGDLNGSPAKAANAYIDFMDNNALAGTTGFWVRPGEQPKIIEIQI